MDVPSTPDRERSAWWLLVLGLGAVVAYVLLSFLGTVVFGLFLYYATRPAYRRMHAVVDHRGLAAALTMLTIALPAMAVVGWVFLQAIQELGPTLLDYQYLIDQYVDVSALTDAPWQTVVAIVLDPESATFSRTVSTAIAYLRTITNGLAHVFLAVALAFYLLRDQSRLAAWFTDEFGEDSAARAYVTAVDRDLQTIYFSNVILVGLVALLAMVVYHAYNAVAPTTIHIPFPTALALATGLASLIPLVVGKVVYVPLTGFLAFVASQEPSASLAYPAGLFAVSLLFLDLVPMTFLLPELAGRETHVGLVMVAYITGTMLFGWYGLFLGPLVVVLVVQAVRIPFPDLVHGNPVSAAVESARSIGSDPD